MTEPKPPYPENCAIDDCQQRLLRAEIDRLRAEIGDLKSINDDLQQKVHELRAESERLRGANLNQARRMTELDERVAELEAALGEPCTFPQCNSQITELSARVAELESSDKGLRAELKRYNDEPYWEGRWRDEANRTAELEAASAWQPIETAPKNEMFIYYLPRNGKRCIGLAYLAKDGSWRDSEGNWRTRLEPTKWMPLPSPPADKA